MRQEQRQRGRGRVTTGKGRKDSLRPETCAKGVTDRRLRRQTGRQGGMAYVGRRGRTRKKRAIVDKIKTGWDGVRK